MKIETSWQELPSGAVQLDSKDQSTIKLRGIEYKKLVETSNKLTGSQLFARIAEFALRLLGAFTIVPLLFAEYRERFSILADEILNLKEKTLYCHRKGLSNSVDKFPTTFSNSITEETSKIVNMASADCFLKVELDHGEVIKREYVIKKANGSPLNGPEILSILQDKLKSIQNSYGTDANVQEYNWLMLCKEHGKNDFLAIKQNGRFVNSPTSSSESGYSGTGTGEAALSMTSHFAKRMGFEKKKMMENGEFILGAHGELLVV